MRVSFIAFALLLGAITPAPARPIALTDAGIAIPCMSCDRTRIASGRSTDLPTSYRAGGSRCRPI